MKKSIILTFILFLTIAVNSQESKSDFNKTIDSINAILKANPLAYYTDNNKNSAFIKKISANQQGIITFKDSIPEPEIKTTKHNGKELLPDCCPPKKIRTLDLLSIKQWEIYFPNAYLKDQNNQNYGRIIGIRKEDLYTLKEQFDKLATLSRMRETETKF